MPEGPRTVTLRTALIEQLGYLIEEVEALKAVIGLIPEAVLAARPPGEERSIKELYGLLADRDAYEYRPYLGTRLSETPEDTVAMGERVLEADWNTWGVEDILERVQAERRRLVAQLQEMAPSDWHQVSPDEGALDVYAIAHRITLHDAAVLQQIGNRLHESSSVRR